MTIALCGASALEIYFQSRQIASYPKAKHLSIQSVSKKEIFSFIEANGFTSSGSIEIALSFESHGRATHSSTLPDNSKVKYHMLSADLYGNAFIQCQDFYIACPELCFLQMAQRLNLLDLVLLGYKMCGDYRPSRERWPTGNMPLTSVAKLKTYLAQQTNVRGLVNARRALSLILDNSNSHMESRLSIVLISPRRYGGYELKKPVLNQGIPHTIRTGDLCWLEEGLVIEYDSEENHSQEFQKDSDSIRRTEIELSTPGMKVITVRKSQVMVQGNLDQVVNLAAKKLGITTYTRVKNYQAKKADLHKLLFLTNHDIDTGQN